MEQRVPRHAAGLVRAVHRAARTQAVQSAHRPVRARRRHVEHLLGLVHGSHLPRVLRPRRSCCRVPARRFKEFPPRRSRRRSPSPRRSRNSEGRRSAGGREQLAALDSWRDGPRSRRSSTSSSRVTTEGTGLRCARSPDRGLRQRRHAVVREADVHPARLHRPQARRRGLAVERQPIAEAPAARDLLAGDLEAPCGSVSMPAAALVLEAHAGLTAEEHAAEVEASSPSPATPASARGSYRHCTTGRWSNCSTSSANRDFTGYIVSGGGRDFMRPVHQRDLRHSAGRVVGIRQIRLTFERQDGRTVHLRLQPSSWARRTRARPNRSASGARIGRRPMLAAGNSSGRRRDARVRAGRDGRRCARGRLTTTPSANTPIRDLAHRQDAERDPGARPPGAAGPW